MDKLSQVGHHHYIPGRVIWLSDVHIEIYERGDIKSKINVEVDYGRGPQIRFGATKKKRLGFAVTQTFECYFL